ncbi:Glycosyltransferase, GT2 family [Butyrivibrio proteoclasticus]|uniref:Glycosyltransferase, GT2 family n=1 Tax=Butyrivibrio proteoclasticus TaxID=43305 RepID=A0A1I5W3K5_9FIRM|nr:glycosyltransferase [Butyrivibrio proteoclasticus]SFQ14263.1 Glycosyltransferase, GT2 family [Butyrivibrio proteoclasticus]
MYERLQELISSGDYKEALYELQEEFFHIDRKTDKDAARLCLLEASLWEMLEDTTAEFDAIARGLKYDPCNYELFYMLGLIYKDINLNKAYLCVQQALLYCEVPEDAATIKDMLFELKKDSSLRVKKLSVMVLSYNDLEFLRKCIESIENTCFMEDIEVVVVDNDSTDVLVKEFLKEKRATAKYTFKLIESGENLGFPLGCNLGARNCDRDRDIFFLNNDAVLMPNSVFFLRMGLYENKNVGAVSALSNSASLQEVEPLCFEKYAGKKLENCWHKKLALDESLKIFGNYSKDNAVPRHNPYIRRFRLTGFALMVSKEALDAVAPDREVFDGRFSPGYFEDDDLGIRIARAGFMQYVCDNSFIYHHGGGGFEGHNEAMENSRKKFIDKWGFDIWSFSLQWDEACAAIVAIYDERREPLRVIDFTCGFGATASFLKHEIPDIYVAGVCRTSFAAGIANNMADEVAWGDLNLCRLPWKDHSFDVALIDRNDVCKVRASQYIKQNGIIIDEGFV